MNKNDLDELRKREVAAFKEKRRSRRNYLDAIGEKNDLKERLAELKNENIEIEAQIEKIVNTDTIPSANSTEPYEKFLYLKQRYLKRIDALEVLAHEEKDRRIDCYNLASIRGKEGNHHEQAALILEAKGHDDMMTDYNTQIFDLWAEICQCEKKAKEESGITELENRLACNKKEIHRIRKDLVGVESKIKYLRHEYGKARSRHAFIKESLKKATRNPNGE